MRIDLSPNGEVFAKQVAQLRRGLAPLAEGETQQAASARMAAAVFVPFLTALRTALRADEVVPAQVVCAVSDLCANIAETAVESLLDAPPDVIIEQVEQLLFRAKETAARSIVIATEGEAQAQAEATRSKLELIMGGKPPEGPVTAIRGRSLAEQYMQHPVLPTTCPACHSETPERRTVTNEYGSRECTHPWHGLKAPLAEDDEDDERIARET